VVGKAVPSLDDSAEFGIDHLNCTGICTAIGLCKRKCLNYNSSCRWFESHLGHLARRGIAARSLADGPMTEAETQLLELLKERSFKAGTFKLASGAESNYYIDGRMSAVFSKGTYLIGRVLYERTKDLQFDALGGLEVGAVPLTAAVAMHYHLNGRTLEGFWVRDKQKAHGMRKLIEGGVRPGDRVVIVDDVITSGQSALKAVEAVKELGCTVVMALALVDRLQGADAAFREIGVEFRSVFTIRDLGVDVPAGASTVAG
jgi:orotate phosphoribosyltransferase